METSTMQKSDVFQRIGDLKVNIKKLSDRAENIRTHAKQNRFSKIDLEMLFELEESMVHLFAQFKRGLTVRDDHIELV